ncbi:GNAT family N-acetyltransferase [Streptomyces sp. NBC_00443]|uniref:GNAT family N-acetyltransferase n=1 Tax=Streptomyces sp. NBC_00443 TaxID=2975743 RepID=UPI002E1E601C
MTFRDPLAIQRASLRDEIRLLGRTAPGSWVYERDGIRAAVVPAAPNQPIANMVSYESTSGLVSGLGDLADAFHGAGVRCWTAWVPEHDGAARDALRAEGYERTARLPAIVMDLAKFAPPDLSGLRYDVGSDIARLGRINEQAHDSGHDLAAALSTPPDGVNVHVLHAYLDGEPVAAVATLDHPGPDGLDCGLYFGATLPHVRKQGLGTRILAAAMVEARERGCVTASGQASEMGAPVWLKMGFQTVFMFETYERTGGRDVG